MTQDRTLEALAARLGPVERWHLRRTERAWTAAAPAVGVLLLLVGAGTLVRIATTLASGAERLALGLGALALAAGLASLGRFFWERLVLALREELACRDRT